MEFELTRLRGHIIFCVQGAAKVQSQAAVSGAVHHQRGRSSRH